MFKDVGEDRLEAIPEDLEIGSCRSLLPAPGSALMLTPFLEKRAEAAYTLLRIVAGLMFAFHGAQKIFGVMSNFRPPAGTQLWFGGIIELVAGVCIAAGIYTAWAALIASGEMAVAYIQFHWKLEFGERFFPAVNQGELALLYSVVFLFIACRGTGKYGLRRP
jgi:putative oxidoreductase